MHQSGLVFKDRHFVCEQCSKKHSDEEINEWSKSVMRQPECGMPIALWLIHEQNKGKQVLIQHKK